MTVPIPKSRMIRKRDYSQDPLHLWPPGALDDPLHYRVELPRIGFYIEESFACSFGHSLYGTVLLERETSTTWFVWDRDFLADPQPDVRTLYEAIRMKMNCERSTVIFLLLLDLCADFLCKRGWVEVVQNHIIINPDQRLWYRRDEWR